MLESLADLINAGNEAIYAALATIWCAINEAINLSAVRVALFLFAGILFFLMVSGDTRYDRESAVSKWVMIPFLFCLAAGLLLTFAVIPFSDRLCNNG